MKKTLLLIILMITINSYSQTQRLDNINNTWIFSYDNNNIYQGYEIQEEEQENVTYNTENLVDTEIFKSWNGTGYENHRKNVFTYGTDQKISQKVVYNWNNNQWIEDSTYIYTYNSENLLTEFSSDGSGGSKDVYTYNTNNKLLLIENFSWDNNINNYSQNAHLKYEFAYDNNENIDTSIQYIKNGNNEWVIEEKMEHTYDNNYDESDLIIPFFLNQDAERLFCFNHKLTQTEYFSYNYTTLAYESEDVYNFNYTDTSLSTSSIDIQNYTIYPNPTTNQVKFDITDFEKIEIYDITGKLITKTKTNIVNMENVPNGTYLYRIQKGNETISGKIIKK